MNSGRYSILIVEDNPGDVRLIKESLRKYKVEYEMAHYTAADTAIQAIARCGLDGSTVPDLILLDYNVPRGDGRDILSAAMRNPALARTPKVVVTSSMAAEDREQAMKLGAQRFIIKPSSLDAFLAEIGEAIVHLLELGAHPVGIQAARS